MDKITISMSEKKYTVDKENSIKDFIDEFVKDDAHEFLLAMKDGKLTELSRKIKRNCHIELITRGSVMGYDTYRRSLTLLMVKAFADILETKKDYAVNVLYSMGTGYYCKLISRLDGNKTVKPDDELIAKVKNRMQEIVDDDIKIHKMSISVDDAITRFEKQGRFDKANLFVYMNRSTVVCPNPQAITSVFVFCQLNNLLPIPFVLIRFVYDKPR